MIGGGVARRYARAIFELARDRGILDRVGEDLRVVAEYAARAEVRRMLHNPLLPVERKQEVFNVALGERVDRHVAELVRLVLRKGRESLLPQIATEFESLVRRERNVVQAEVTAARPLSDQLQEQLRRRLEELWGKRVELSLKVDPGIIGGLVLEVGDRRIDGSLRGRLSSLRQILAGRDGGMGAGVATRQRFHEG